MNINIEEIKKELKRDVEVHFKQFFTEYNLPEELIELAVNDVLETSAIEFEGHYNSSDVSLACQRVIIRKLELDI